MTNSIKPPLFIDSIILNSVQKKAVTYNTGPQLVFAGAGTGKTRVLTTKIAYLIKENGIVPYQIFAATFTNKAAREMSSRVEDLIKISCSGLWIGTFHSLCARILRREAHQLGYTSSFTIYDTTDQLALIKKVIKEMGLDERTMPPKYLLHLISKYKNTCKAPNEIDDTDKSYFAKEVINAYSLYQRKLKESQAMDFDDLLTNTVFLFRKNAAVLNMYQKMFQYILVDEYQDTNFAQFQLVYLLAQIHQNIFAVGDDDQSIYSWRGARIENILSFNKEFPGTRTFKLEQNYRSSQTILDFAHAIISNNKTRVNKKLWTTQREHQQVVVNQYRDDRQEAETVVAKIAELKTKGQDLSEVAILFRTNAQSRIFEDVLRKHNIRYIIIGGTGFYDRKEVKDCLAYLRLLVNPKDTISCERILNTPTRGIGRITQEKLSSQARLQGDSLFETILKENYKAITGKRTLQGLDNFRHTFVSLRESMKNNAPPQELLKEMLLESGYLDLLKQEDTEKNRQRLENVNELVNVLTIWYEENSQGTLTDFLEEISLITDIDGWNQDSNAVNLMTLHAAKGLEFKVIFLVGIEDGLLPSKQNFNDPAKIEEECRLLYVGATRARKILECSYANSRMRFGAILPMDQSRFLEVIPADLFRFVDHSTILSNILVTKPKPTHSRGKPRNASSSRIMTNMNDFNDFSQESVQFRIGQMVSHNKYGHGKVTAISGFGLDIQLTILFKDGIRRQMMARYAKLEIL